MAQPGHTGKTFLRVGILILSLGLASGGLAQTITKNSNTGTLAGGSDWTGGTAPGSTSIALWTNTSAGTTFSLGANLTWGEIKIVNPTGNVTFNAGNTLTLNGVNGVGIDMSTASRTLTINPEVILGASQTWLTGTGGGLTIGGSLSMGANQLTIGGTGNATLSGVVSGTGKLDMNGSGLLTLGSANTYSGGTIISNGTVLASTLFNTGSSSSSIGTGSLTLNGGTLRYSGASGATATFSTTLGANGGTLDYASSSFSYIFYNGTLSGSGTLNILDSNGNGNQWLFTAASSGFTGNINIGDGTANSGWLQVRGVTAANQVGTGTVTVNGGGTFSYDTGSAATIANPIVLNGGALGAQSVGITYSGPIVISNNSFIGGVQTSVGTTMTLSGAITGPGGFTTAGNNGTTTIMLANANTFSGGATISSGTLSLNNSLAVQNSTIYDLTNNALAFGTPTSYTLGGLSGTGNIGLTNSAGGIGLSVGNNNANTTYSGVLSGSGSLTKIGSGTLTLSGTAANTYSGLTTVSGGELDLGKTAGVNAIGGNLTIAGGEVKLIANNQIGNSAVVSVNSGSFNLNGGNETVGITTIGSAGLLTNGTAGAMLGGGISNNGTIYLSASTLFTGIVTNNGTMFFQGTISNNLVNSGNGSITLGNTSTITQTSTINGGTLNLNGQAMSNGQLLVNGTGVVTNGVAGATVNGGVSNAATIALTANTFFNGPVTNTGALFFQGTISNNLASAGTVTLNNDSVVTGTAQINGGSLNLNGNDLSGGRVVIAAGALLTNGVAGGSVSAGLTNAGTIYVSQLTYLNGAVTNTGTMIYQGWVSNNLVSSGSITLNGNATITQNATVNGGVFNLNGQTYSNNLMVLTGTGVLTNSSGTAATFNGGLSNAATFASPQVFFNGTVTNTGAFFFNNDVVSNNFVNGGSGTVTLNNTATITRTFTINGGTLNLNGQTMSNGLLVVDGGAGVVTNSVAGATVNGGVSNAATIAVTANTFFNGPVTNTGALFFQGAISNNLTSTGTVTLNNDSVVTGTAQINGGSLNLNGNDLSGGRVVIGAGALLTNGVAGGSVSAGLTNAGTIFVSQTTYLNGPVTNTGAIFFQGFVSNALVNSGSFNLNNSATLTAAPANSGTINAGASTLTVNPAWANSGTVQLGGGVLAGGNLTNNAGGNVAGFGTISNQLVNAGLVTATNGNLNLVGAANGSGVYRAVAGASAATLTFVNGGSINSLFDTNATIVVEGFLTNNGVFANAGTLLVAGGAYQSGANVTNIAGATIANSGAGSLNAAAVFNLGTILATNATFTISNLVAQGGTVTIGAGGTLTVPGASSLTNFGTINLQGAAGNNAVLNLGGAVLTNQSGGTITGGGIIQNASQVVNLSGGSILATSAVVELQFTNANTFGNGGTIGATAGATLTFGAAGTGSAIITNFGTINLARGTLRSGNITNLASGFFGGTGVVVGAVVNQGRMNFSGTISNGLQNSGSFTLNDDTTVTSNIVVNSSGVLDLVGNNLTNNALLVIGSGGVLTNGGAANAGAMVNGGVSNAGTVYVTANTFFNGTVTNTGAFFFQGAISNNLVNSGNGTMTLNNTATITQTATVNGGTLNLNGQAMANGQLLVNGTGVVTNGVAGATVSGGVNNANVIAVTANTFFNGPVTNTGTFQWQGAISNTFVNSGTTKLNGAGTITGTSTITAGSVDLNGKSLSDSLMVVTSAGVLTNSTAGASVNGVVNLQNAVLSGQLVTNAATLSGSGTISAPLVNSAAGVLTANSGLLTVSGTLTQNGTVNVAAGSTLNVQQAFNNSGSLNMQGGFLTGGSVNNTAGNNIGGFGTISNALVNSAGALITASGGTLTLANGLTQSGGVLVNSGGTLQVAPDWASSGTITVNGTIIGGTLTNTSGTGTLSGSGTINSLVVNQGRVNWGGTMNNYLQTAGSFTVNGGATITGVATINGGTLDLVGGRLTDGLLAIGTAGTLTNSVQNATLVGGITNAGTVNLFRDTYVNGPVTNTGTWIQRGAISNNVVNSGVMAFYTNSINVRITGSIVNSGSLTFDTNGTVYVSGVVSNSGSFAFSDVISNNLVNSTGGSITLAGAGTVTGNTMIEGGTLNLNGQSLTDALMVVDGAGGVLTNSVAGATLNGGLSNASVVAVTANTFFKGPVTNTGTFQWQGAISNTFVNSGTTKLNGAGTITGTATVTAGSFDLNGKGLFDSLMVVTSGGVLTNSTAGASVNGAINLQNGVMSGQLVTNAATLSGSGTVSAPLVNSATGVITANSGLLTVSGALTQNGTVNVAAGSTLNVQQAFNNSGSLNMQGGLLEGGTVTVTSGDNISGFGTISNAIINQGLITATGGTLTLAGSALTAQTGSGINVASGGTLNVASDWSDSGTLNVSGTLIGGTVTNIGSTGTLSGSGTITAFVVNQGRVNWGGTMSSYLQTAGSLTLSGNATFTGNATISGGGFDLVNNLLTAGLLTINNGATMQNSGGVGTITGSVVNNGTVNFNLNDLLDDSSVAINGQVVNNGTWTQAGTINGTLVNTGSFDWTSHTYFFGLGTEASPLLNGGVNNTGSLTFDPSYVAHVTGSVTNSGAINFNGTIGGNLWQSGGTFTLNNAGTISGPAGINGGVFNLNGENYNGSTMVVSGTGALTNAVAGANFNSGLSNAANVGVTANTFFKGAVTNTGTFAFMGAVSNTLVNSGDVILNGSGTISGALVNNGSVNVNNGTLSLVVAPTQNGSITVSSGATLNAAQAWVNSGTVTVLGGTVTNGTITSTGFIGGYGTIDGGGVVNNGKVLANAGSIASTGTLTVRLSSFTNNNAATIGTASSNAVLNIVQSGNILINQGTVSLSGGTIDFNGGSGTITNYNIIAGVGNVASFPIINAGTLASFVAQAPIPGLSNLIATVGVTNNGLLGANNLINGAATLSLTVNGGGSAIVNQGTVAMQGGYITVNGGAGVITNNSLVYGVGTQNLAVANMATGKIMASNGVFSLGLQGNANAGVLSNLNAASTVALSNNFLKNTGTVVLNGGGLLMNGVITNESSITGPGAISSSLYNDTPGTVLITNGVMNLSTNTGDFVENLGLFSITSDGTLNVASAWLNTNGTVNIVGGGLMGGAVTNVGLVNGFGTISSQLVNMGSGTLTASGAGALTLVAAPTQNGWVNIANAGTLNVLQAWQNSGTVNMQGGNLVGSTVTNSGTIFGSGTITPQVRNASGGRVTANGGTLTLTVAPSQLGSVVISNAATLNVLQAWQNNGTFSLFGGTAIGSTIANAASISGYGTINPQVQNTGGGTVTATGGTLTLATAPSQLGTFVVANGGTLNVLQAWQNAGMLSMAGGTAIGSTITNAANVSGFGTITPQLVNNGGATVTATGGTLTLAAAPVQLGNLVVSNGATLNALQAWQNSGTMRMRGGTVIGSGITNGGSLEGFGTFSPQVINNAGATLTADSGLLTLALALIQNGNAIVTNGGTLNVLQAWQNSGTIAMAGGNIIGSTVTNAGRMTGFGGIQSAVNNSLIYVTNGTLQATASFAQNGTVNIAANSQLNVTPSWLNTGTILLNGGFTSGGTLTNTSTGLFAGFGTVSNTVVNTGSMVATNGTLALINALTQTGTVTVDNAATLSSIPAWQNGGLLSMLGGSVVGGTLTNAGSITGFGTFSPSLLNNSGATITASSGGTLTLTAIPFQNGIVNILGTLNVASAWSNGSAGTVTINGGVLTGGTFTVDGTVGGNGTIAANMIVNGGKSVTVNGGTLSLKALTSLNGGAFNSGALVNYGTISGYGTIGSTLSNPGYVRATNGLLYVAALSGNQATGTLEASRGGTLQANGVNSWINNGQVILSGGTVIGGDISNSFSHGISGFGTIAPNVYNGGQLMANNAGQPLTLNSSLVNLSSGTVGANNGNLVVDGTFMNQGTLAMTHSVGTFASAVVNSGAWITDPTTNVFQNTYTLAGSGYIQAGGGDVYVFTNNGSHVANFVNQSTQSNAFNTVSAKFVFDASLTLTQQFYAAGRNIGDLSISGGFGAVLVGIAATNALVQFQSNFALGTLEIDNTTEVAGADINGGFDPGGQNALFVNELDLAPDAHLIISNDVQIYFISSNAFTSSQVTLLGNAGLHLLTSDASLVVPEPSIVLLWLSSIATIYAARRRAASRK
ncbi:MAG TPA: autotransporter-associated beta strand repeat-containing protein [Verrucomicrobiae bacterium]|nr:autotransporter-associated beta strand repeat-containing protein [Verrucomicrobiae bacterium]